MTNKLLHSEPSEKKTTPRKHHRPISSTSLYSPKLSLYLVATCVTLFILFQIKSLQIPSSSPSPSQWTFMQNWQNIIINTTLTFKNCTQDLKSANLKLQESVTFLPLKDIRYTQTAQQGHTWFMSSMYDTQEKGEVQYQQFPSNSSKGRVLCIKGRDNHDGAWNSYALAWPEALPENATLMKGITFVSNNHYNYDNI